MYHRMFLLFDRLYYRIIMYRYCYVVYHIDNISIISCSVSQDNVSIIGWGVSQDNVSIIGWEISQDNVLLSHVYCRIMFLLSDVVYHRIMFLLSDVVYHRIMFPLYCVVYHMQGNVPIILHSVSQDKLCSLCKHLVTISHNNDMCSYLAEDSDRLMIMGSAFMKPLYSNMGHCLKLPLLFS